MIIGLCEAMPTLADDATCRAIVMRGRGGVFCAGRELRDLKALQGADREAVATMYGYMQKMNEVIYDSPHPVISRRREICLRHRHDAGQLERHRAGRGRRAARLPGSSSRHHPVWRGADAAQHDEPEGDARPAADRPKDRRARRRCGSGSSAAWFPPTSSQASSTAFSRHLPWQRRRDPAVEAVRQGMRDAYLRSRASPRRPDKQSRALACPRCARASPRSWTSEKPTGPESATPGCCTALKSLIDI